MKVFAELTLRSDTIEALSDGLRKFCNAVKGWSTDEKKNQHFSVMADAPSFWVIPPKKLLRVPVAIALAGCKSTRGKMELSNIVPQQGQLSVDEYNYAATEFVRHFRALMKRRIVQRIRVEFSSGIIGLEEVIPGPATRKCFEQYLANYPTSYHPCDIERLDRFIVALDRGNRCANAYRIADYLVQDLGWSVNDATWVRDRIITGLEILEVNRSFSYVKRPYLDPPRQLG